MNGNELKALREFLGINQYDLAVKTKIKRHKLQLYESGHDVLDSNDISFINSILKNEAVKKKAMIEKKFGV